MGHSSYRLYLYLEAETPSEYATLLRSNAEQALQDSNVSLEVVTLGPNAPDEAIRTLEKLDIESYPSAVLVSPEGQVRQIPLPAISDGPTVAIRQTMDSVVRSQRRDEMLSQLTTVHSVVLLIEGRDPAQNRLAKKMAAGAVEQIEATLPYLPKPIDIPPQVLTLSAEEAQQEAIMLWSLGVDVETRQGAQIVMVFGRGRKLGPVMDVGEIKEQDLLRTLAVAGFDCECDLDRSWMQTPMFPHVWNESNEAQAVKDLGFDPGHPLVQVEISRIIRRGPSSGGLSKIATPDRLLPGLQIIDLNFEEEGEGVVVEKINVSERDDSSLDPSALAPSHDASNATGLAQGNNNADPELPRETQPEFEANRPTTSPELLDSQGVTSTTRIVFVTLFGLAILVLLGASIVMFTGRSNDS